MSQNVGFYCLSLSAVIKPEADADAERRALACSDTSCCAKFGSPQTHQCEKAECRFTHTRGAHAVQQDRQHRWKPESPYAESNASFTSSLAAFQIIWKYTIITWKYLEAKRWLRAHGASMSSLKFKFSRTFMNYGVLELYSRAVHTSLIKEGTKEIL